jgi:mevalonate kinase
MKELQSEMALYNSTLSQGLVTVIYIVGNILSDFIWKTGSITEAYEIKVSVKSHGLPIAAGLGSSAAFSVALVGACIEIVHKMSFPEETQSALKNQWQIPDPDVLMIINSWAFVAEILNHTLPSGLDNTTCFYGGLLQYKRSSDGQSTFERITESPFLNILLTNTKVSRSTKALVRTVSDLYEQHPNIVNPIFSAIEMISKRFIQILESKSYLKDSDESLSEIANLFDINHALLVSLGVSHNSLELVHKESTAAGYSCKLTGAGGGGCAMTLLPWRGEIADKGENFSDLKKRLR